MEMKKNIQLLEVPESDPFSGKISNDSPIAQALIGKKVGEEVTIQTPGGSMLVKITKVEQA